MAARTVTITVEVLAATHGVWCPSCALPSAVTVTYALTVGGRTTVDTATRCPDCGAAC